MTGCRGLCFFFFSQYFILFANETGSKIKKHAGRSTRGGGVYHPLAGVTTRTRRVRVVLGRTHISPSVFLILV